MVTIRIASAEAAGASIRQFPAPCVSFHTQKVPAPDKSRNGMGVFTATHTRKKYHQPPPRIRPNKYEGSARAFFFKALAMPFSNDGAGSEGFIAITVPATRFTGPGSFPKRAKSRSEEHTSELQSLRHL